MAQFIQTYQGEGESDGNAYDIHEWLRQNRLLKFKDQIDDLEITVQDLLNFTAEQIELIVYRNFFGITTINGMYY